MCNESHDILKGDVKTGDQICCFEDKIISVIAEIIL
jgi:hypothetical protein